jgi:NADH-quinone oxidoreductase subunit N
MAPLVQDLGVLLPELVLAIGTMILLMVGVFRGDRSTGLVSNLTIGLFIVTTILVLRAPADVKLAFSGGFVTSAFTTFMKVLVLLGAAIAILMSERFIKSERLERFEYPILIAFSAVGMMMMISANDLISLYIGLELQSLALYVLAAYNRDSVRSTEAGLKYFVLGALSSGLFLYGATLIYGFTGATNFDAIAAVAAQDKINVGLTVGLVFLLSGLAFKIAAVPFHMWTPDVYEGAPTPVTAFFAAAPKLAAVAMTLRVLIDPFLAVTQQWQQIIVLISILSMALGSFAAIGQTNIKRLMAYSSIANVGHVLVGLAAGSKEGIEGVLIYLAIYLVMTLGTFAVILSMRRSEGMVESIDELSGLSTRQPLLALALAILLFSLAGIPPLAGFMAKFYVYLAAVEADLWILAVVGILTSVVGAYYYIRIVLIMYNGEPAGGPFEGPISGSMQVILGASSLLMLLLFVFPAPLIQAASRAAEVLIK